LIEVKLMAAGARRIGEPLTFGDVAAVGVQRLQLVRILRRGAEAEPGNRKAGEKPQRPRKSIICHRTARPKNESRRDLIL
jgi:hypothetical protein